MVWSLQPETGMDNLRRLYIPWRGSETLPRAGAVTAGSSQQEAQAGLTAGVIPKQSMN